MKNSLLVHKHLIIRAEASRPPTDEEYLKNWTIDFIESIESVESVETLEFMIDPIDFIESIDSIDSIESIISYKYEIV